MNNVVQFPGTFRPRVVSEWRPKRDELVEAIGQCCRVMAVEDEIVIISGRNEIGQAWTMPMHVRNVKPWREPMTRIREVMGVHADEQPEPPRAA